MGVGLLVGVWLARYLGPEQFGLLNFASALIGILGIIAGMGLQSIVVRDIVHNPNAAGEILGSAGVLLVTGSFIAYSFTLMSIFLLRPNDQMALNIVAILGSIILFKISDMAVYWFESQVLSKYVVWIQNSVFLCFAGAKVVLILQQANLLSFAWLAMIEALFVASLLLLMLGLRGPRLLQIKITMERSKALLAAGWPLLLSGLTIMVYMKIDQIMLGQMVGDKAVGIYSAALRISEVWYFLPMTIVASVFPSILEAKKHSDRLYKKRLQQLYDFMVWLSIAIALPMTFFSSKIVDLLYGSDFTESGHVLAIHIWAAVFVFLGISSSRWFIAENRQILSLQRAILGLIVNVVLNIFLIPNYGVIGAAWATLLAQLCVGLLFDAVNRETHPMLKMKIQAFNPMRIFWISKRYFR